jgi:hypothetical protein
MKGATTDPWARINSPPRINITIIIGANHNFLRTRRNVQSSIKNSIFLPVLKLLFE